VAMFERPAPAATTSETVIADLQRTPHDLAIRLMRGCCRLSNCSRGACTISWKRDCAAGPGTCR
jgi:hypothetical protein